MKLIHVFWKCLRCGTEIEILEDDFEYGVIECDKCGYSMEIDDYRFETLEKEY